MEAFHGIIIYEILENGNLLNAVYTNTGLKDKKTGEFPIDNEIARRIPNTTDGLGGSYTCRYIEHISSKVTHCDLIITKTNEVYEFSWVINGKPVWSGIGLMAGDRHIAVSYI